MELEKDKKLKCVDCNKDFVFTSKDQRFYEEKKYKDPKRCKECRKVKRERRAKDENRN